MSIWVFDTLDRCNTINPPNAVGTIYADGECQTIETSMSTDSPDYALFPGTYRAFCTTQGLIRFHESGCIEPTCSTTSFEDNAVCSRDNSKISALYSRLDPPEYIVQEVDDASTGGLYTCLRLLGSGINVTFVVFGDCSDSGCATYDGGAPTAPVPTNPPVVQLPSPTDPPEPTDPPAPPPTDKPVPEPTDKPVAQPTTKKPTRSPVTAPTTEEPTVEPTNAPVETPTASPSTGPTFAPIAEGAPTRLPTTETPTGAPTSPAPIVPDKPTANSNAKSDRISSALFFTPMEKILPPGDDGKTGDNGKTGLFLWEEATMLQIRAHAESEGITVTQMLIKNVEQELKAGGAAARRFLEEQTLGIFFDLSMTYFSEITPAPPLQEIFDGAFATESARNNYLLKFAQSDDPDFDSLRVISVATVAQSPAGGGGGSIGIIAGVIVGILVASAVAGFLWYRHKKKNKAIDKNTENKEMSMGNAINAFKTKEETPVSNTGPPNVNGAQQQVRWTNEILVDASADDVSTLGGSVLAGLNLAEGGNHGEDEPTASVNLDYDYDRQQYKTDIDDIRSRSVTDASGTAFTSFSKLGLLGDSVFADDVSFEQQYADEDEAMMDGGETSRRPKPFEVRAPPGMLGMVIDTPNGGVPVVRAIKPDSILTGRVQIGDRLISVDHQDVTSMTALEVSNLISVKSNRQRLLVFVRLTNGKV